MQGILGFLSGAPQAANNAGSYYQNAAGQIVNQYGSPAAQTFVAEQNAALQPGFTQQRNDIVDRENALGILHSGAASNDLQNLYGQQSGALASAAAPLYQQALGQYGSIIGAMPSAENSAYQQAIQQFIEAASAAAGAPGVGGGGGGGVSADPYGTGSAAGFDNASQLLYSEPGVYQGGGASGALSGVPYGNPYPAGAA